jgi:hypothetical protein
VLIVTSAPVFVRQQFGDRHDRRRSPVRHDDARVAIVIEDQFAAGPTRRHHRDGLIFLLRPGMAHGDNRIDAGVAEINKGAAQRHRLGAYRHAPQIGIEIDPGEDLT